MIPGYVPVSKRRRCPICGKPNWCLIAKDGSHAICPRVESGEPFGDAGWKHPLEGAIANHVRTYASAEPKAAEPTIDCDSLQVELTANADDDWILETAGELGVSFSSLVRLGIGQTMMSHATFPMYNGDCDIVGFRVRRPDGRKYAITGSRSGVFVPRLDEHAEVVYITEGPTDTAAVLTLGLYAIGRPSCMGGAKYVSALIEKMNWDPVIICDNDGPGIDGAQRLSRMLGVARIISPPRGIKDVRAWVADGVTADVVGLMTDNAGYVGEI